ncbi:MAG: hypothetical protein ACT6FG_00140 [Methanosarcinaceae archaeon]
MPTGTGITAEQKEFIRMNKDEMFIGQMAYRTGLSRGTIKRHIKS